MREFRILGPIEVLDEGERAAIGGPRQQAALLVLALNAGRLVGVDQMIDGVWGEHPPVAAVKTVRAYVSRLRQVLGDDCLVVESGGYRLELNGAVLDAQRFADLVTASREALEDDAAARAERLLAEASGLWRGSVVGQGAELEALPIEAARLQELRWTACELQLDAWLALGNNEEVIDSAERLLVHEKLREGVWERLMLALYRTGRQADALAAYRRARTLLNNELALEPGPALRDLEGQILRHDVSTPAGEHAAGKLPAPVTSFIGRKSELSELGALLDTARMITLLGVGGAGKTRLAIEAASRWQTDRGAPAWFVDLAPASDPALVTSTVMVTIGSAELPGTTPLDALIAHLSARRALLVLDNCEHLLDECARLTVALLETCPRLLVLATSRASLEIAGETRYIVPPLATPDARTPRWRPELPAGYDAIQLFLERGRAARGATPVANHQIEAVADLCRRLDGLPLAIEFAAARLRSMSITDIAAGMSDRFALLNQQRRASPERHQTLKAAIDWSHDLLNPHDQILLRRLSVFRGGFTGEAARAVCSDGIASDLTDGLDRLVSASLIVAQPDQDPIRYRTYETVREYADEQLTDPDERSDLSERHARYFCEVAEHAANELLGPHEHRWFQRLDSEHDNLRAALAWAADNADTAPDLLARTAVSLGHFWRTQGTLDEGAGWLRTALERTPEPSALRAGLLIWLGSIRGRQSEYDEARRICEEGVHIARELGAMTLVGQGLHYVGMMYRMQRRFAEAIPFLEEENALFESTGDLAAAAWSLGSLGDIAVCEGRYDDATTFYERGLSVLREQGPPSRIVAYLHSMAELAFATDKLDRAQELCDEALPLAEEIGEYWHIGLLHQVLAWLHRARGQTGPSSAHAIRGLEQSLDLQDMNGVADAIETLAGIALDEDRPDRAAALLAGAEHLRRARGIPIQMVRLRQITDADHATSAALLGSEAEKIHELAIALPSNSSSHAHWTIADPARSESGTRGGRRPSLRSTSHISARARATSSARKRSRRGEPMLPHASRCRAPVARRAGRQSLPPSVGQEAVADQLEHLRRLAGWAGLRRQSGTDPRSAELGA